MGFLAAQAPALRTQREAAAVHFGAEPGQRGLAVPENRPGKVGPAQLRLRGAVIARGTATAAWAEEIELKRVRRAPRRRVRRGRRAPATRDSKAVAGRGRVRLVPFSASA